MAEESITPEDEKTIQEELDKARKALVSDETEKKIEAAKEEVRKELAKEQIIKEKEEEIAKLRKLQEDNEKKSAEEIQKMKAKVEALVESKATITPVDPFKNQPGVDVKTQKLAAIDAMSPTEIDDFEKEAGEAFWGEDHYIRLGREK